MRWKKYANVYAVAWVVKLREKCVCRGEKKKK